MDTVADLKNDLISRIQSSQDLKFLKALQTLLDSAEQPVFGLSEEQQQAINSGRQEIADGKSKPHSQVISEMKEWLTKK
ncbi:hypothetical protein J0A68_14325 [Algoriphagus sp. H41]|uniref:Addiction module component n=1 Tax=Algoriphagus oliviformis TaxID=2811231 RepID=A0ABS3C7K6_9BACT|nr:hypothetical protein [Algoriphagus oliviformis]MBN7812125.1 hypothetical protein [Algoriphagus oliviformis]